MNNFIISIITGLNLGVSIVIFYILRDKDKLIEIVEKVLRINSKEFELLHEHIRNLEDKLKDKNEVTNYGSLDNHNRDKDTNFNYSL